jgi:hypothetical protein
MRILLVTREMVAKAFSPENGKTRDAFAEAENLYLKAWCDTL